MKRFSLLLALALVFTGCAAPAQSSTPTPGEARSQPAESVTPETQELNPMIYRGQVAYTTEQTIEVVQVLPGHDYGQERIRFNVDDNTTLEGADGALQEGAYVEVQWSGILTRSDPPMATADHIVVISSVSDMVLLNGRITEVVDTDEGWRLTVEPFTPTEAKATIEEIERMMELHDPDEERDTVLLNLPAMALEGLTVEDLQPGTEVSAVTMGVAALSMPPQYPVHALLPFSRGI